MAGPDALTLKAMGTLHQVRLGRATALHVDAAKHSVALQHQLTGQRLDAHLRITGVVAFGLVGVGDVGPVHVSRLWYQQG